MQIQVNTDDNLTGRESLVSRIQSEVSAGLSRFNEYVTRIEIHLGDENAGKAGSGDKRCMIEARPAGQPPVSVTHHAANLDEAFKGALRKVRGALDTKIGQLHHHKGSPSIRDIEPTE
jgi:hypothetical protein